MVAGFEEGDEEGGGPACAEDEDVNLLHLAPLVVGCIFEAMRW